MRRLAWLILVVTLVIWGGMGQPLLGQIPTDRVYEPFVPTPEYEQAWRMLRGGQETEFRARLAQIAAQNPGTTLAAVCLGKQAQWSDTRAESAAIQQAIIAAYPRSRFEVFARLNLLSLQYGYTDMEGWIGAADQLAQSYGGPPLNAILSGGNQDRLSAQVHALPIEIQRGLDDLYGELLGGIAYQLHQYERAVPLALFNQQTFALLGNTQARHDLMFVLGMKRDGVWKGFTSTIVNPTVRILNRKNGAVTGPRPKFQLELSTGDYKTRQIDLSQSTFRLDGQDFKPRLTMRSKVDQSLKPGRLFERIRLSGRPAQPLAPGPHTLELVVIVGGYQGTGPGVTRVNLAFTVGRSHDDHDDECDDDD